MSTYIQEPHKLDTNVIINVPNRIAVTYVSLYDYWVIIIDGIAKPEVYYSATDAIDWLISKDLIKTKVYAELDKKVKKVPRPKSTKVQGS